MKTRYNYFHYFIVLMLSFSFSEEINNSKYQKIPDITLKDINKKKIKLIDLAKDNYIVFNFWNMACEPCKKEMKFLNEFHKKYNQYNFKIISINMDTPRSMSKVKKYVKSSNYEFDVLTDPRQDLFKKMGGAIMPFVVVVDNKGNIINKHVGYNLGDEVSLEQEIIDLINFSNENDGENR